MSLYERLRELYLNADRITSPDRSQLWWKIPEDDMKRLVWEAAKDSGQSKQPMPWETGEAYKRRMDDAAQ